MPYLFISIKQFQGMNHIFLFSIFHIISGYLNQSNKPRFDQNKQFFIAFQLKCPEYIQLLSMLFSLFLRGSRGELFMIIFTFEHFENLNLKLQIYVNCEIFKNFHIIYFNIKNNRNKMLLYFFLYTFCLSVYESLF